MIMIGLIDKLSRRSLKRDGNGDAANPASTVSHFFCESHDKFHNNSVSVLRGLLYMLLTKRPELLPHLEEAFRTAGPRLFEDPHHNLFQTLKRIFLKTIEDGKLGSALFLLDGLDECESDVDSLIDLILQSSNTRTSNIRWIISSRKNDSFIKKLESKSHTIDLEQNQAHVKEAVHNYIDLKLNSLDYSESTTAEVSEYLKTKSGDTFLWVHLVFKMLVEDDVSEWDVLSVLEQVPPGLDAFYERMFQKVSVNKRDSNLGYQVLGITITAYRPMRLAEMVHVLQLPKNLESFLQAKTKEFASEYLVDQLEKIIGKCASFLSVRGETVYIVHKSAQDFLWEQKSKMLFPTGPGLFHQQLGDKCLELLSKNLRQDILESRDPGALKNLRQIRSRHASMKTKDPTFQLEYGAAFWVSHRKEATLDEKFETLPTITKKESSSSMAKFLQEHILHWIEVLSVLGILPTIFESLDGLESLTKHLPESEERSTTLQIIRETASFLQLRFEVIRSAPLQVYMVLYLFDSDNYELLRKSMMPSEIYPSVTIVTPSSKPDPSGCLFVLERDYVVYNVLFSSTSKLVTWGGTYTVRVWDTKRGVCEHSFNFTESQGVPVTVIFIDNGGKIFVVTSNWIVFILTCQVGHTGGKVTTHDYLPKFYGFVRLWKWKIRSPNISPRAGNSQVVTFYEDKAHIWDITPEEVSATPLDLAYIRDIEQCTVHEIATISSNEQLVVCSRYNQPGVAVLEVWNSKTRGYITFELPAYEANPALFVFSQLISNYSSIYFIYSLTNTTEIRILDVGGEVPIDIGTLKIPGWNSIPRFEMIHKTDMFAASQDTTIYVWRIGFAVPIYSFESQDRVGNITVSPDNQLLASTHKGIAQGMVKLWDLSKATRQPPQLWLGPDIKPQLPVVYETRNIEHKPVVSRLTLSPCGGFAACIRKGDKGVVVQIYRTATGGVKTLPLPDSKSILGMEFWETGDHKSLFLVSISQDLYLQWWDLSDPETRHGEILSHVILAGDYESILKNNPSLSKHSTPPIIQLSGDSKLLGYAISGLYLSEQQGQDRTPQCRYKDNLFFPVDGQVSELVKTPRKWPVTVELYRINTIASEEAPHPLEFAQSFSTEFVYESLIQPLTNRIKFSPNNKQLAIIFNGRDFLLLDTESGEFINCSHAKFSTIAAAEFTPDSGKLIVLHSEVGTIGIRTVSILDCYSGALLKKCILTKYGITNDMRFVSESNVPLSITTRGDTIWARTDLVTITISLNSAESTTEVHPLHYKSDDSFSFILDNSWLIYGGQRIIWIPPDFRPARGGWKVKHDMVVILSRLGMVYSLRLDLDQIKLYPGESQH
ncbi:hypothetical protein H072_9879 [Dactylellina haptotyla CBS 200.50]|uniref:Nephrocystin 3-like N-terminal domain-containing protein n=1 Tax=Dactylellina haptotyla (strain CBS 200.50) TaxID=1284197 RepID=S8A0N6_DACHA|nr:hypothetical protein H072_9879 [Dactylellina haptotyla CBS 200.50]